MNCPSCQTDVSTATAGDGVLPKCPRCGSHVLPPEAEAELEGFRARLAKFGLGADRLPRSAASKGEL